MCALLSLKSHIEKHKKTYAVLILGYSIFNVLYCLFLGYMSQTEWYRIKCMLLFRPIFNLPFIVQALIWHMFILSVIWIASKINRKGYEKTGFVSNAVVFFFVLIVRLVIYEILSVFGMLIRYSLPYSLISVVLSIMLGCIVSINEKGSVM